MSGEETKVTRIGGVREKAYEKGAVGILALMGIAGFVFFIAALVSLHFLRPEYDPTKRFMSEYAVGPYGYLMTAALLGLGIGSVALSLGIGRALKPSRASQAGKILLGVWAAGMLTSGLFTTDLTGDPTTTSGAIHSTAAFVAFPSLIASIFLLSRGFERDTRWRGLRSPSRILGLAVLGTFVFSFLGSWALGGLGTGQRIFAAATLLWLLVTAVWLRGVATHTAAAEVTAGDIGALPNNPGG